MKGEINLTKIIKGMTPYLNKGEYVFLSINDFNGIDKEDIICQFKEEEGVTLIINKEKADELNFKYEFVSSWITLKIHSSLNAVGFTAAVSKELTKHNISCNVIAGYYHDHLFVNVKDKDRAMQILKELSNNY